MVLVCVDGLSYVIGLDGVYVGVEGCEYLWCVGVVG